MRQIIVLSYLSITGGAFFYTMTGYTILPMHVIYWSYGMMAPYQYDWPYNTEIIYEAILPEECTAIIDMTPYMPYGFGERGARQHLRLYEPLGQLEHRKFFTAFGQQLLARERERRKIYEGINIYYDKWPRSPAGYEFLHTPVFTTRELLTTVR